MAATGQTGRLPSFSSRIAFILVTAGAAVGLGNVWGFPYVAGENGGGGFMAIYLLALVFVAMPAFMAELLLGRMGKASPPEALKKLQKEAGSALPWPVIMWVGLVGTILILSFYSVIAGEALFYGFHAITEGFKGLSTDSIKSIDQGFKADIGVISLWAGLFLAATAIIVSSNLKTGIEFVGKWLTPTLFLMLIGLVIYSAIYGDFAAAVNFLFGFDKLAITPKVLMEAVGQAFFTLSIGVGGIMMYGAYMGGEVNLPRATIWIVIMDLSVALLAGLMIFPLVFAENVSASAGPGLVFETLPIIFTRVVGGDIVGLIFFLLLTFAAITSSISLLAPTVARLEEAGWSRRSAAWLMAGIAFLLSFLTNFSFNIWSDFHPLSSIGLDGTIFALIRQGVSNIILPTAGVAFAFMIGWALSKERVMDALPMKDGAAFRIWYFSLRFIVPVAITLLFLNALFGG